MSCLRTYTPAELEALAGDLDATGCSWRAGQVGTVPIPVTYLLGVPTALHTRAA